MEQGHVCSNLSARNRAFKRLLDALSMHDKVPFPFLSLIVSYA